MSSQGDGARAPEARLTFSEELQGFAGAGETDFDGGFRKGEAEGSSLTLRLTIQVEDVFGFVSRPGEVAGVTGAVSSRLVGGDSPVQQGWFQLFVRDGEPPKKHMRYRLFFSDAGGSPLTLSGFKTINDDPGFDVWREASTLYSRILSGHVDLAGEPGAAIVAAGIVRVDLLDVLRELASFRVEAADQVTRLEALARFGAFYLGNLWGTGR
jgi:cholesterol oxidase